MTATSRLYQTDVPANRNSFEKSIKNKLNHCLISLLVEAAGVLAIRLNE